MNLPRPIQGETGVGPHLPVGQGSGPAPGGFCGSGCWRPLRSPSHNKKWSNFALWRARPTMRCKWCSAGAIHPVCPCAGLQIAARRLCGRRLPSDRAHHAPFPGRRSTSQANGCPVLSSRRNAPRRSLGLAGGGVATRRNRWRIHNPTTAPGGCCQASSGEPGAARHRAVRSRRWI